MSNFQIELTQLLNRHSKENESNTPDFILAKYLLDCLGSFNNAIAARKSWYGAELAVVAVEPEDVKQEIKRIPNVPKGIAG